MGIVKRAITISRSPKCAINWCADASLSVFLILSIIYMIEKEPEVQRVYLNDLPKALLLKAVQTRFISIENARSFPHTLRTEERRDAVSEREVSCPGLIAVA